MHDFWSDHGKNWLPCNDIFSSGGGIITNGIAMSSTKSSIYGQNNGSVQGRPSDSTNRNSIHELKHKKRKSFIFVKKLAWPELQLLKEKYALEEKLSDLRMSSFLFFSTSTPPSFSFVILLIIYVRAFHIHGPFRLSDMKRGLPSFFFVLFEDHNYDMYEEWENQETIMHHPRIAVAGLTWILSTVLFIKICFDGGLPEESTWIKCNSTVLSWIFNSLYSSLQESVAFFTTAQEMWKDLEERFSQGNAHRIHQLINTLQQRMTVSVYYTKLKGIWDELNIYSQNPACISGSIKALVAEREKEKVHQFLMSLNEKYNTVHSQILNLDPLPSLSHAYALVTQKERQQSITSSRLPFVESTAFMTTNTSKISGNRKFTDGSDRTAILEDNHPLFSLKLKPNQTKP
ncbi:Retrotransposon gag domain [Dillenia turbinata]|uniref:Retrotransposon gag domain n=1 Tax=Dillenia turbinata TaxID=194707 RepID=A0AAN8UM34_9MAGN